MARQDALRYGKEVEDKRQAEDVIKTEIDRIKKEHADIEKRIKEEEIKI